LGLTETILWIIRVYKPPRSILHNILYLKTDNIEGLRWTLSLTGVYSERVDNIIEELLNSGSIRMCNDGRLTTDQCPDRRVNYKGIVDEAIKKYLVNETTGSATSTFIDKVFVKTSLSRES
jgi:uncharacterized protein YwgA